MGNTLLFLLFCVVAYSMAHQHWKVSKAMKSTLKVVDEQLVEEEKLRFEAEARERKELKIRNIETKSFQELRHIFYPIYDGEHGKSLNSLIPFQLTKNEGTRHEPLWDLVGENQTWDLVFVDHHPMEKRTASVSRLLKRTKVLIIHDTEGFIYNNNWMNFPVDFVQSGGDIWNGHPCFTDASDLTEISMSSDLPIVTSSFETTIWTTLISGDLDKDKKVFNSIVRAFNDNFDDLNAGYRHINKENIDYGTHARLLLVAAMMTQGDILELGTGDHSTKLLHDILEEDNRNEKRMLVSADSDPLWLDRFSDLSSPFHQMLLVKPWGKP